MRGCTIAPPSNMVTSMFWAYRIAFIAVLLPSFACAAEQPTDATEQFLLGLKYDKGKGTPENNAEAIKWYRLAAEQGLSDAQYFLGRMYDDGDGVPFEHELFAQ